MRLRRAIIISLPLVFLLSSVAFPATWQSTDKYLALRRQSKALMGQAATNAQADPSQSLGGVIELKGSVSGVMRTGDGSAFILNTNTQSYVIKCSDSDPQIDPGSIIRALVKIGPACMGSLSDLILIGAAWDYEITARENKEIARIQNLKKRPIISKRPMTTRGFTRQEILAGTWLDALGPYKNAIAGFNKKLTPQQAESIAACILSYSEKYDVDPRFIVAVILAESHFRVTATSRKGAMGLGQLMPGTAAGLGVSNPYDPQQNLEGSIRLIRGHLNKLSGGARWTQLTPEHISLALASYNAGPGAVRKYRGVPPYRETRAYITKISEIYKRLCGYK
ncbi:MAG: lytic transglycosylase domain-containing protein [Armatimonadota bacterium]|nr:lytic transglycosylase domain-containing protein [Armatimonadota bacterium]